jgi:prepilin-type processing-associated H-X9-DG protein
MSTNAPTGIEARGEREIAIAWADGHASLYASAELRFACSCARCVDEWSGKRTLDRKDVAADIHPVEMQLVGNYALQITWSDGHSTGLYTWDALRRQCPCTDCTGRVEDGGR